MNHRQDAENIARPRQRIPQKLSPNTRVPACLWGNVSTIYRISNSIADSTTAAKWEYSNQLPYKHIRHRNHILELANTTCLLFHKTFGPLWHWLLLSSLRIEPTSSASKRVIHHFPSLLKTINSFHNTAASSSLMLLFSFGCITCSTVMLAWQCDPRNKASIFVITIMLLALGGSQWDRVEGSVVEFFLVYMPLAVSIGFSLGLPLRERAN